MSSLRVDSIHWNKKKLSYMARLQIIGTRRTFLEKIADIIADKTLLNQLESSQAASLMSFNMLTRMDKDGASNDRVGL